MQESKVLSFNVEAAKCPVGGHAILPNVGWCEVVAANGFERTVSYEVYDLVDGTVGHEEATVDVRDLREINPRKDLAAKVGPSVASMFDRVVRK